MSFFFNYPPSQHSFSFFFNDTATTEIYTLSLHDALPISLRAEWSSRGPPRTQRGWQDHHHQNDVRAGHANRRARASEWLRHRQRASYGRKASRGCAGRSPQRLLVALRLAEPALLVPPQRTFTQVHRPPPPLPVQF